jgi:hypothetical protein
MKTDRTNYEIWLIDMIDGNLSSLQVEELKEFLKLNPDLQEEFNGLTGVTLTPPEMNFERKKTLKKTGSEITDTQFGLLSVGYLEGDLSDNQKAELQDIIRSDPDREMEFDLIQKLKISPSAEVFKNKHQLIKLTVIQKTLRFSAAAISVAAAIILFIIVFPFNEGKQQVLTGNIPVTAVTDNTKEIQNNRELAAKKDIQKKTAIKKPVKILTAQKTTPEATTSQTETLEPAADSSVFNRGPGISRVKYKSGFEMNINNPATSLIASATTYNNTQFDDERSNLSRLFARTFREKILGQDNKTDSPLKGYEIAEAGVDGLNKLFGWEMALDKNNDTNGELNSVYFSSKIIKFNTPVKKTEPLP